MICGIILAAGDSSRMGKPKALLDYRGKTFLETVCDAMRSAGIYDITVVLGRHEEQILAGWKRNCERVTQNLRPSDGQISSLNAGLAALPPYADLLKAAQARPESIIVPRCNGKRGHPIILPANTWPLCAQAPLDKGLHWVTHHPDVSLYDVEVSDAAILRDIDTPAEYAVLNGGAAA